MVNLSLKIILNIIFNYCDCFAVTEKVTTEEPSCDISRLDIELLPGQTLRVKVSNVESVSKFHIQFSSANYCDEAISSYMAKKDPKVRGFFNLKARFFIQIGFHFIQKYCNILNLMHFSGT